jgi:hypothetical protein
MPTARKPKWPALTPPSTAVCCTAALRPRRRLVPLECRWGDVESGGGGAAPPIDGAAVPMPRPVVMQRNGSRSNALRARAETAAGAMAAKTVMVLECPVLPCWDESDDGVPSVRRRT